MPAKTERTIIQLGHAQVVTMPHDWVEGMGLKTGDRVEVIYDEAVTIRPVKMKREAER
ncbi:MAG: AbrB/MazE/SpoVT family DNA-binding domain-containing protein [Candidatus Bathyarchaeia archaeon]|jgi:antitoxin component of MazEF toxin-antitoxin module